MEMQYQHGNALRTTLQFPQQLDLSHHGRSKDTSLHVENFTFQLLARLISISRKVRREDIQPDRVQSARRETSEVNVLWTLNPTTHLRGLTAHLSSI